MKRFLLICFCSIMGLSAMAQPENREQKIKALYVAYISQELKFTEDEAQKFWPVHSLYDSDVRGVKFNMPELERQQSILNIKKKYEDRFSKILGQERTDNFFRKDAEFRKKLVERLRNMKQQNRNRQMLGNPRQ